MTNTDDIRRSFHQLIDGIEDDQSLTNLYAAATLYLEQERLLLDTTDPSLLNRMRTSVAQAERGDYVSNEVMQQQIVWTNQLTVVNLLDSRSEQRQQ